MLEQRTQGPQPKPTIYAFGSPSKRTPEHHTTPHKKRGYRSSGPYQLHLPVILRDRSVSSTATRSKSTERTFAFGESMRRKAHSFVVARIAFSIGAERRPQMILMRSLQVVGELAAGLSGPVRPHSGDVLGRWR